MGHLMARPISYPTFGLYVDLMSANCANVIPRRARGTAARPPPTPASCKRWAKQCRSFSCSSGPGAKARCSTSNCSVWDKAEGPNRPKESVGRGRTDDHRRGFTLVSRQSPRFPVPENAEPKGQQYTLGTSYEKLACQQVPRGDFLSPDGPGDPQTPWDT